MTDAPKTIWAGIDRMNPDIDGGSWVSERCNGCEYTLTSSVQAQLKAADELAERAQLDGDTDGISDEMWQALTAYRKARETSK